jgi:hypothetical protein
MKDSILSYNDLQQESIIETVKPRKKSKKTTEYIDELSIDECPKKTSKKLEEKYKKLNDKLDQTIKKLNKDT